MKQKRMTLTVAEMAAELNISKPTAYEIANRADFPTLRVGRRIIIPREAFERWLLDNATNKINFCSDRW